MKLRRRTIAIALSTAVLVMVMLVIVMWPMRVEPISGTWAGIVSYQGADPGLVGLIIEEGGRVQAMATPNSPVWWTAKQYELHLHGDTIEVRSGQKVSGELQLKQRREKLSILDRSWPVEVLRLRKINNT